MTPDTNQKPATHTNGPGLNLPTQMDKITPARRRHLWGWAAPLLALLLLASSCSDNTPLDVDPGQNDDNLAVDGGVIEDTGGSPCEEEDFILCHGTCIDPRADNLNCGDCDQACQDTETCEEGKCKPIKCEPLETVCDRQCVDTDHHHDHCGECGNQCYPDEMCTRGECLAECSHNLTRCGSHCVNLNADPNHCGQCHLTCKPEETCMSGECQADRCPEGLTDCYGGCVNIQVDNNHCGRCGHQCLEDEICWAATCILDCQEGLTDCNLACVDTVTDTQHCGGCNRPCSPGEICKNGECHLTCQEGLTNCMGVCTNLQTDRTNCGFCTNHCPDGQVCVRGSCSLNCPTGLNKCGGDCVNIHTDRFNCGECGLSCSSGQICSFGQCETTCPQGQTPCGDICSTLSNDDFNCGECGKICQEGYTCREGECRLACPVGYQACDSECVITSTDNNHCGDCGIPCLGGAVCQNGQCTTMVTGLTVSPQTTRLNINDQLILTATVSPPNATDNHLTWASSDSGVATVNSNGAVTGVTAGRAVITASTRDGGYSASCMVTITTPVAAVTLIPEAIYLRPEQVAHLEAVVLPEDATNKGVTWTSSNPSIATVDSAGMVQAGVSLGETTITVTTVDGNKQASSTVSVNTTPVTGVTISPKSIMTFPGEQTQFTATVSPVSASNRAILWYSADPSIATVDPYGVATPLMVGQTTITAITVDGGYKDTAVITGGVAVTGVEVTPTTLNLPRGSQFSLTHQISPEDATIPGVSWSSNNPSVASVSENGLIKALDVGSATITVTTDDGGFVASCRVTVVIPVTGITLNPTNLTMASRDMAPITANIQPANAGNKTVIWSSMNPAVATVVSRGETTTVTARGSGSTTIVGTTEDGGYTASTTVKVGNYEFTTHTFTTCSYSGYSGPTLSYCRNAYNVSWANSPTNYNVVNGVQTWTVPDTGIYRIEARGAQGGGTYGGLGAVMVGDFDLTINQQLRILVGHIGTAGNYNTGGGGGASAVSIGTTTVLIVAGGGGGSGHFYDDTVSAAVTTTTGTNGYQHLTYRAGGVGGANGNGGTGMYDGAGGGGWLTNGTGYYTAGGSQLRANAPYGGNNYSRGGFGGGGSGYINSRSGGGGGGYSGGGGGGLYACGGGGGSINNGTNTANQGGVNTGHGSVTITRL